MIMIKITLKRWTLPGLALMVLLAVDVLASAQPLEEVTPEGYALKSVTVGDTEVEYFDVSDIAKLSDEELSEIAPAAGNVKPQEFVGPRRSSPTNNVWATENLE